MSNTGKQSPLGINVLGQFVNNIGLNINPVAASYMGESKTNAQYTFGRIVQDTVLRLQTWGIHQAYISNLDPDIYNNLIHIGSDNGNEPQRHNPAMGNAPSFTYTVEDPTGVWTDIAVKYGKQKGEGSCRPGPATAGYAITSDTDQGQEATWYPYLWENQNRSVTQWGFTRCFALQAWNEFNWNGETVTRAHPEYKEFLTSFTTYESFAQITNQNINTLLNAPDFLDGAYSNMDDLITADVSGISLALWQFGTDFLNTGYAIDLTTVDTFGLPSNLLRTIYNRNTLIDDLVLALIASGLTTEEINFIITTKEYVTVDQEQKIYGAFLVIQGESLREILSVLECRLELNDLSELLEVNKLFPTSYASITVPIYNTVQTPNNSKTYYLIYQGGSTNAQIMSPAINKIVGAQVVKGRDYNDSASITELPEGFGSYLYSILPRQIAVACGAFSYSMQQVKNITNITDSKRFSQAIRSLEIASGLPATNGSTVPVNLGACEQATVKYALGSGIGGSYTMSDFFGCMSGLPYHWSRIYQLIKSLQTRKLHNIYRENFLALCWERGEISPLYETREVEIEPEVFITEYRMAGVTLVSDGGGYGRGSAPAPGINASNGAEFEVTIGTDDRDARSAGGGTFGRITSIVMLDPGAWVTSPPTVSIDQPPIGTLAVQPNGDVASNGENSPPSTTELNPNRVSRYIEQANDEIESINLSNHGNADMLRKYWDISCEQLAREQRARYIGQQPVPVVQSIAWMYDKDYFLTNNSNITSFVDSVPLYALDTRPHMTVQTLEAIADIGTIGGQSLIAMMREFRNKTRLSIVEVQLDNNIQDTLSEDTRKKLLANGTTQSTIGISGICDTFTNPAWSYTVSATGSLTTPIPKGKYVDGKLLAAANYTQGDITSILTQCTNVSALSNNVTTTLPPLPPFDPYVVTVSTDVNPALPPELDMDYASSGVIPSVVTVVQDAIDQVTECNCDCWLD